MSPIYEIVWFDATELPPGSDLAALHQALLPASLVAILGTRFMEKLYYKCLPRENLIFGAVAYVDRQPAGFIVGTHNSRFMGAALRRHGISLLWILGLTIVQEPARRFRAIWEAWNIMRHRTGAKPQFMGAEILSFGVLPKYCSARFVQQTGLRLSADLFSAMVERLAREGASTIRAVVDADNIPAKLFYHSMGWRLEETGPAGWRVPTVEFRCHL